MLGGDLLHQGFGVLQEGLVVSGVVAALGDQVIQELGHLLVELGVGELVALQGDADVVDDALSDRVLGQLALGVELLGDSIVHAGLDDELREGEIAQVAQVPDRIGLDIGVQQVAHVGLVGLGVQLLAGVLLDG